jgi:hypothetical protein
MVQVLTGFVVDDTAALTANVTLSGLRRLVQAKDIRTTGKELLPPGATR